MADPVLFSNGRAAWSTATTTGANLSQISGVKSVEIPFSMAELDDAVMGDTVEAMFPGLISAPISVTLRQDFTTAAAGIDQTCWDRWSNRRKFMFEAAAQNATADGTNPFYRFDRVSLFAYNPINGEHGVLLENPVQLRMLSGCSITRVTSS